MRRILRRPAAAPSAVLVACLGLAGPAAARPPAPPAPGEAFADAHSVAEIARSAKGLRRGGRLHLEGLKLDSGGPPLGLDLVRFEVFAPDGRVVVHGPDGEEERPFPANAYFRGRVIAEPDSLAVVTVLEDGGVRGVVRRAGGFWELGAGSPRADGSRGLAVRRVEAPEDAAEARFACAADELLPPPEPAASTAAPATASEGGSVEPLATKATTSYTARVAVETDWELYQRFGSEAALTDYVGDLFAYSSSVYDREIDTDLQVTHLSIWATSADPWTQTTSSCGFYEFGRFWNDNRAGVTRTLAHFVSGKSTSSGIAWLGILCNGAFNVNLGTSCPGLTPSTDDYGGAYGFSGGITGSFNPGSPSPVWDIVVVSHEIGHNFNSPHTHCYAGIGGSSSPVDECYGAEPGCHSGTTSLPGPAGTGSGTLMSYCHFQSGGLSNIGLTFGAGHPYGDLPHRVPDRMRAHVESRAASYPTCLARMDGGGGPCDDVALPGQTVGTTELYEACGTLRAGSGGFTVVSPGNVTLRAGIVVLESGFSVGAGARLRVETQ